MLNRHLGLTRRSRTRVNYFHFRTVFIVGHVSKLNGNTILMTMTMTIHLLSGIAAHRTYDYIHTESNRTIIHRLHICHFKSIKSISKIMQCFPVNMHGIKVMIYIMESTLGTLLRRPYTGFLRKTVQLSTLHA